MRITYDPAKREKTLRCRGLDFEDVDRVFAGRTLTIPDKRRDYGEDRYQTIGYLQGRMVMIVWTPRREDDRHVFSMRKCNAREQARYQERLREAGRDDR